MPSRDLAEVEERLRRLPAALAVAPPVGLLERVVLRGRRRRLRRRAGGGALVAILLTAAVTTRAVMLDRPDHTTAGAGGVHSATAAQLARGHWRQLPPLPIPSTERIGDRIGTAVVWAGDQLLIWGGGPGNNPHRDGWSYDPRGGRWQPLPLAPVGMSDPHAVWTGREVLVWGTVESHDPPYGAAPAAGLAYDPARHTWRRLPAPPRPFHGLNAAVWTGRELLVVTIARPSAPPQDEPTGAAYDLATNRWRRLAPTPTKLNTNRHPVGAIVWTETRLLVWPELTNGGIAAGASLWAYDPAADRWSVLPSPSKRTSAVLSPLQLVWTGRGLVEAGIGYFDPDHDRVTPIAPLPEPAAGIAWTGAALAAILPGKPLDGKVGAAAWDPPTDRWLRLPSPPERAPGLPVGGPFWTGLGLLYWSPFDIRSPINVLVPAR
jgi:hypothetical protein